MAFGTFDILHIGHLMYLNEAKKLGAELIVVVACDESVRKEKGRDPIVPEKERKEIIESLKVVDEAVIGYEGNRLKIVEELSPDVVALGPDQDVDEGDLKRRIGKDIKIVRTDRYVEGWKTQNIIEKIWKIKR